MRPVRDSQGTDLRGKSSAVDFNFVVSNGMRNTSSVLLALLWSSVFVATPAALSGTVIEPSDYVALPSLPSVQTTVYSSLPYDTLATASSSVVQKVTVSAEPEHLKPSASPTKKPLKIVQQGKIIPVHVRIPAALVDSPIQHVGINEKGEADVPSGSSNAVGWYKYGPLPGHKGSAVLDAHVFAAFARLKDVQPGDDIYIDMSDGSERHFRVSTTRVFPLVSLSPSQLFRPTSRADLNLITCAGSLTADGSTYDHRLIVYSTLVREKSSG